jgi:hypothetical protein
MAIYTGVKLYKTEKNFILAVGKEDVVRFSKCAEEPIQISDEIYLSEKITDFIAKLSLNEFKEGGILAGWGLYKISSTGSKNSRIVNAKTPADALETVCNSTLEFWEWHLNYSVKMLTPGANYTGKALTDLIQTITEFKKVENFAKAICTF